jgi:hypothetical protein
VTGRAHGQFAGLYDVENTATSIPVDGSNPVRHSPPSTGSLEPVRRGVLAKLVRNPDTSGGLPPFALTDQAGTIQRYVEPTAGVDLEPYVDQVVTVRHDTGRTLLASQLELPHQPLVSLLDDSRDSSDSGARQPTVGWDTGLNRAVQLSASGTLPPVAPINRKTTTHQPGSRPASIHPVQFADDDDATVELLPDGGNQSATELLGEAQDKSRPQASDRLSTESQIVVDADGAPNVEPVTESEGGPLVESPSGDTQLPPPLVDGWGHADRYPEFGDFHETLEYAPGYAEDFPLAGPPQNGPATRLFADVEFNFFRTHLADNVLGKLSEQYEFSPRVTLGFRDTGKLDGRARYWSHDRDTRSLAGGTVNVEFDVLDLEGTHVFLGRRSELQLASGLRLASIDLSEGGTTAGADLLGITFAADGRTCLGSFQEGLFTWVYGGRLAILGGDWGGEQGNAFVTSLTQDDNVVVHELHSGIDYALCHGDIEFHGRLGFELQNWHSDALAQNSIGIIGPSFLIGAEF